MGQYYKACLVSEDEIKVIVPSGIKMMEHCWYGNKGMERVEKLLSEKHYRVMWLWDYSPCASFVWNSPLKEDEEDVSNEEFDLLEHKPDKVYYLVNHTRMEYINMTKQEHNDDIKDNYWDVVHPLWLLCRLETEEAWWDYRSEINQHLLWIWCWDEISVLEVDWEREIELDYYKYQDRTNVYFFKE